jgi:hypothetical protein
MLSVFDVSRGSADEPRSEIEDMQVEDQIEVSTSEQKPDVKFGRQGGASQILVSSFALHATLRFSMTFTYHPQRNPPAQATAGSKR